MNNRTLLRCGLIFTTVLASCAAGIYSSLLFYKTSMIPQWDMAEYLWRSQRMAQLILACDGTGLLFDVNTQVFHPPLLPIIGIPFQLTCHSRGCSGPFSIWICWTILLLGIWKLGGIGDQFLRNRLPYIAVSSVILSAFSPLLLRFGNLFMTEIPGAMLIVWTIVMYLRSFDQSNSNRLSARFAGIGMTLVFLCKYNYLIFLIPLLVAGEWSRNQSLQTIRIDRHRLIVYVVTGLLIPILTILAAYSATLQDEVQILGMDVSVRGLSNVLYGVIAVVLITLLGGVDFLLSRLSGQMGLRSSIHVQTTVLIHWGCIPVLIWVLLPSPNRIYAIIRFCVNRTSGLTGLENTLFYPSVLSSHVIGQPIIMACLTMGFSSDCCFSHCMNIKCQDL